MTEKTMTPSEAAALVAADRESRAKAAGEAIQAALTKHNCDIVTIPQIVDGRIVAQVQIVAR